MVLPGYVSAHRSFEYNPVVMKNLAIIAVLIAFCLTACNRSANPSPSSSSAPSTATPSKPPDAVQQKLEELAGASATNCGRLEVHAPEAQSKSASDCAMQAAQARHAFYVGYDMPGMSVGVAGNSEGKLFSVQSQGDGPSAALTSGACPSELRVASSGRVTCFAPGDMGSMGAGHTAIPPGMPNPHAMPKKN